MEIYDLIVIGAGPAGLTAALYASRYKLKALVLGKEVGGQVNYIHDLENYPGFDKITGLEFIDKLTSQIKKPGVDIKQEEVIEASKDKVFTVKTHEGTYFSRTLILALGRESKKLNIQNEDKFLGKGISYCATCDAPLFKDKTVVVIGSGNAAAMTSLLLAEYAKKVYIIAKYKKDDMKIEKIRLDKIEKNPKIEIIQSSIKEIKGTKFIEAILLDNGLFLDVQGIFVEIGKIPITYLAEKLGVKTDKKGYILVNEKKETNVKGLFAAGDCTSNLFKQVLTAASDGSMAAKSVYEFLKLGEDELRNS
jgi:thioredoxin reductase (NADPH)